MVKFSYYGHACFLLDDGKYKILADPFLTGNPAASIKAEDVKCDYILVTHAHGDHIGDAAAIAARTGAEVISTPEVLGLCEGTSGNFKGHGMNIGGSLTLPFGKVRMVFAQHSSGVQGGIACGYVIYIAGLVVYFAGDTALFSDMELIGKKDNIDFALLPIGDNYTMGLEDAAMATKLLGTRHVIPIHYDTWPVIQQDVKHFKEITESLSRASVHIVKPGEDLELELCDAKA